MSVDLKAVADGLAAKYAPGTIATPTGAEPMRGSYGQMPEELAGTPSVVVFPESGEIVPGSGMWTVTHQMDVYFYMSKVGDLARAEEQRQLWLPNLLTACLANMTLGVANVKSALPSGYEFVEMIYGGTTYDGIIVHYDVIVREPVTFTA